MIFVLGVVGPLFNWVVKLGVLARVCLSSLFVASGVGALLGAILGARLESWAVDVADDCEFVRFFAVFLFVALSGLANGMEFVDFNSTGSLLSVAWVEVGFELVDTILGT